MNKEISFGKLFILFIPWAASLLFSKNPVVSYFIAWSGSFFIFFLTLSGKINPLPTDRSFAEQIMRPIILVQLIFAGYTCCTSIFYIMDTFGYENFTSPPILYLVDPNKLGVDCQMSTIIHFGTCSICDGDSFGDALSKKAKSSKLKLMKSQIYCLLVQ